MDEDDDFLPFGSEVWEFSVANSREDEFKAALEQSGDAVMEYDVIEDDEELETTTA